MSITIYGIKNCSTVKKALAWFDDHNITYHFHDYKKVGVDDDTLTRAIAQHGWGNVINRRGMTWRNIPENERENMDEDSAILLAHAKPSVIKRPLIDNGREIILGFDVDKYAQAFIK